MHRVRGPEEHERSRPFGYSGLRRACGLLHRAMPRCCSHAHRICPTAFPVGSTTRPETGDSRPRVRHILRPRSSSSSSHHWNAHRLNVQRSGRSVGVSSSCDGCGRTVHAPWPLHLVWLLREGRGHGLGHGRTGQSVVDRRAVRRVFRIRRLDALLAWWSFSLLAAACRGS